MQEDIKERTAVETMKDNMDIQKQHDIHTYTHNKMCYDVSKENSLFCVVSNYYMENIVALPLL